MGIPSSTGQGPPRSAGRPIGSYLARRLAIPAICLVLAWGALTGVVFAGTLRGVIGHPGHRAEIDGALVAGAGLIVALVVILLIWLFVRRLSREAASLALTARYVADEQLPQTVAQLRDGDPRVQQQPVPAGALRIAEFAAVTDALTQVQDTALEAAAAEGRLRGGFRQVLTSLGRRNQSLLLRQLRIIDTLEQQAASPAALADLFTLDHLTTRMRRHAESLTVLSGAPAARPRIGAVPVIDVIRAAVAETEDYKRVAVRTETEETVVASAVNDIIHLLAELIENATLFSPSSTKVEVRAERVANGFAIEVEDRGLGIAPDQLGELNHRLARPPDFDLVDADRLGLFVAGLLATRHHVEVSLTPSPYRGTKAIVLLPEELMLAPALNPFPAGGATAARLDSANALSLVGVTASGALPEPPAGAALDDAAPEQAATTFHGLPRRVRSDRQQPGQQLVPNPGGPAEQPAGRPAERPASAVLGRAGMTPPPDGPAPDDARRLASSLQRSWRRSRAEDFLGGNGDDGGDPQAGDDWQTRDGGRRPGWPLDSEEES